MCSATVKELVKIIKGQVEERSVAVFVLNNASAIFEMLRGDQLRYIDIDGMRVVPNDRCAVEHINGDKFVNVATGGVKMEILEKLAKVKMPRAS